MTTELEGREKSKRGGEASKTKEVTFKCKFCERSKPLGEMVVLNRYFPPIVTCRDCEKKMR
ncbi:MAG: hypothetical protein HY325_05455 [Chloroflexi bacterium]|nr:hypothetical protein [Chloroflexota bacterium]